MSYRCECCRDRAGVEVIVLVEGRRYGATVCDDCRSANHGRGTCLVCGVGAWRCAMLSHLAEEHPSIVEKLANDPDPLGFIAAKVEARKAGPRYVVKDGRKVEE